MRRFVAEEIEPHLQEWESAGEVPLSVHRKAAAVGLMVVGFPQAYGGIEAADGFYRLIAVEDLARSDSGGIVAAPISLGIGMPPIVAMDSEELKQRILPPLLAGDKVAALVITEPSGGTDMANLKSVARRDGDDYVANGQKTFITSGMRADDASRSGVTHDSAYIAPAVAAREHPLL